MLDKDCSPVLRESWPDAWSGSRGSNGGVETRWAVPRGYQAQPHSGCSSNSVIANLPRFIGFR